MSDGSPLPESFLFPGTTLPLPVLAIVPHSALTFLGSSSQSLLGLQAFYLSSPTTPCLPLHPCISPMFLPFWQLYHSHLSPVVISDSVLLSSVKLCPMLPPRMPLGLEYSPEYSPVLLPWPLSLLSAETGSEPPVHYMYAPAPPQWSTPHV